jgi:hypothetical protein
MQEKFQKDSKLVEQFKNSLSSARRETNGIDIEAVKLYQWNAKVSQSLYIYLQTWEICLRNKLNDFLSWKYGIDWPHDETRAVRQLKSNEQKRLKETIERQRREREVPHPSTSTIVADLSAGFGYLFFRSVTKSHLHGDIILLACSG